MLVAAAGVEREHGAEFERGAGRGRAGDVRGVGADLVVRFAEAEDQFAAATALADRQPLDLSFGDPRLVEPLLPQRGFKRAGDVPADDRGVINGRRLATPEAEPDQDAAGRPLLVVHAAVRTDQVVVPIGIKGHALPNRAGLGRRGELRRAEWFADDRAGSDINDVERAGLAIGHQHPAAFAERHDAGRLDHGVYPAVPQESGRGGGRFQPVVMGPGGQGELPGQWRSPRLGGSKGLASVSTPR